MSGPLTNKTVALAEGRQLEELSSLLEHEGANVLRYPMVRIEDNPDETPTLEWVRRLIDDQFTLVVLMTGEAVRRLVSLAERESLRDEFIAALERATLLSRGPKPVKALKELGLEVDLISTAPTSEGVIGSLRTESIEGTVVGVTLYGHDQIPALEEFLEQSGAECALVKPYIYADAVDDERVIGLVAQLAEGSIDCLVITSSPQVDRLFEVAKQQGIESQLLGGMANCRIAAIGPVAADSLRARSAPVHICPEQGFVMKNLVKQIVRAFE